MEMKTRKNLLKILYNIVNFIDYDCLDKTYLTSAFREELDVSKQIGEENWLIIQKRGQFYFIWNFQHDVSMLMSQSDINDLLFYGYLQKVGKIYMIDHNEVEEDVIKRFYDEMDELGLF